MFKNIMYIIGTVLSFLVVLIGLLFFVVGSTEKVTSMAIFGLVIRLIASILLKNFTNRISKIDKKFVMPKINFSLGEWSDTFGLPYSFKGSFTHLFGLPLVEGARCTIFLEDGSIRINGQSVDFIIDKEKLRDISVQKNVEQYRQAVSSTGGALAGAIAFGALGAAIGGRTRMKTYNPVQKALVITYDKDDTVQCIAFKYNFRAYRLTEKFAKTRPRFDSKTIKL